MLIRHNPTTVTLHKDRKIIAQIQIRSDLRAGNDDCELGIQYWRKEYNSIKNQAKAIGCPI